MVAEGSVVVGGLSMEVLVVASVAVVVPVSVSTFVLRFVSVIASKCAFGT
jgi:hypothetical protein